MIISLAVPPPVVTIQRDPPSSQAVSTGDSLTITCSAVISNHVDTPVTVEVQWTDRSSLRDSPRVTVSRASSRPPYDSSVSISSLTSSDTGTYQCCVQIRSSGNPLVNDSDPVCLSIDISACEPISLCQLSKYGSIMNHTGFVQFAHILLDVCISDCTYYSSCAQWCRNSGGSEPINFPGVK